MFGEFRGETGDYSEDDANEHATEGDHEEGQEAENDIYRDDVFFTDLGEHVEHAVENDRHRIVQERFTEDDDVEHVVHVNLGKGGEDSHGVDGGDQRGEDKAGQHVELDMAEDGRKR